MRYIFEFTETIQQVQSCRTHVMTSYHARVTSRNPEISVAAHVAGGEVSGNTADPTDHVVQDLCRVSNSLIDTAAILCHTLPYHIPQVAISFNNLPCITSSDPLIASTTALIHVFDVHRLTLRHSGTARPLETVGPLFIRNGNFRGELMFADRRKYIS